MTLQSTIQGLSPSSYWILGEASGTTATDVQGAHNGTYSGGVTLAQATLASGDSHTAALFDGNTGKMAAPANTYLASGTTKFTWAGLFKVGTWSPTSGNYWEFFSSYWYTTDNNGCGLQGLTNGAALEIQGMRGNAGSMNYTGSINLATATSANAWATATVYFLVLSYDGFLLRVHVNGSLRGQIASTQSIAVAPAGDSFHVASSANGGNCGNVTAQHVAVWDGTCLTGAQIRSISNAALAKTVTARTSTNMGAWIANAPSSYGLIDTFASYGRAPTIVQAFYNWGDTALPDQAFKTAIESRGGNYMFTWQPQASSGSQTGYKLSTLAPSVTGVGSMDSYITQVANACKALTGQAIFIRLAAEMNGNFNTWGTASGNTNANVPADYVTFWQHVHYLFAQAGVTNVRWVWCPIGYYSSSSTLGSCYPGDTYVDYAGFDAYNWGNNIYGGNTYVWQTADDAYGLTYDLISQVTTKPIIICETACSETGQNTGGQTKGQWITQGFGTDLPQSFPNIVAVMWFEENKEENWLVESSTNSQTAWSGAMTGTLYAHSALLWSATTYTKALTAGFSPVGAPARAIAAVRSAVEGVTASRLRALARQVGATLGSAVQAARSAGMARTGAVSSTGTRALLDLRSLTASVQATGARLRAVATARAARLAPVGGTGRAVAWLRSASVGITGAATTTRQRALALVASLSPLGQRVSAAGLARAAGVALAGTRQQVAGWRRAATASLAGAAQRALGVSRAAQPAITAARTGSATLPRVATEALQGGRTLAAGVARSASLGTSGALVRIRQVLRSFAASLAPTAGGQRVLSILRSALVSPTGLGSRLVQLGRGATLPAGGAAQVLRARILDFLASLSPVAGGTRATSLPRQAGLALTGARARALSLARSAAVGLSAALGTIKAKTLTLVGSVSPAGARAATVGAVRVALQTTAATLRRATARGLSGTLAASGVSGVGRVFVRAFAALFQPQASRQDVIQSYRIGTFSLPASLSRSAARRFVGQEAATGSMTIGHAWLRSFAAAVAPGGALARVRRLTLALQATDRAVVALARAEAKSETASAGFAGAAVVNRVKLLFLSAVVGLLGALGTGSSQRTATLILWDVTPATTIQSEAVPATRIDSDIEGVA